jgi:hypothetical protein
MQAPCVSRAAIVRSRHDPLEDAMSNSNPNPAIPPIVPRDDEDQLSDSERGDRLTGERSPLTDDAGAVMDDADDRPLDPDLDDDKIDSAEADRRAATEGTADGTVDVEDLP